MSDAWKTWVARRIAGPGLASPDAVARAEAGLSHHVVAEPPPPGLRRSILSALHDEAHGQRGDSAGRAGALAGVVGRWSLVAAACLGLGLSLLALRAPSPQRPAGTGPAAGATDRALGPASPLSPRRIETVVRRLPSRMEAPLADEARKLGQDARRAAQLVTAAWKPARLTIPTPAAPAPGGSGPSLAPRAG